MAGVNVHARAARESQPRAHVNADASQSHMLARVPAAQIPSATPAADVVLVARAGCVIVR